MVKQQRKKTYGCIWHMGNPTVYISLWSLKLFFYPFFLLMGFYGFHHITLGYVGKRTSYVPCDQTEWSWCLDGHTLHVPMLIASNYNLSPYMSAAWRPHLGWSNPIWFASPAICIIYFFVINSEWKQDLWCRRGLFWIPKDSGSNIPQQKHSRVQW